MEKRISFDQFQSVKRVAQACNPLIVKRNKIRAKIEALAAEYKDYDTQIASLEAGIKQIVGFRVEQLVKKVIEPGVDINGQPKKTTKYLPTDIVSYDDARKQFIVHIPDNNASAPVETTDSAEDTNPTETENTDTASTENSNSSSEENVPEDAPIFE